MLPKFQVKAPRVAGSMLDGEEDDAQEEPTLSKFSYSFSYASRAHVSILHSSAVHGARSFEANSCTNFAQKHHLALNNCLGYGSVRYGQRDIERSKKGLIICFST